MCLQGLLALALPALSKKKRVHFTYTKKTKESSLIHAFVVGSGQGLIIVILIFVFWLWGGEIPAVRTREGERVGRKIGGLLLSPLKADQGKFLMR